MAFYNFAFFFPLFSYYYLFLQVLFLLFYLGTRLVRQTRGSYGPEIGEDVVVADVFEVMGEDAIGLVLVGVVRVALESVDGPIDPVDVSFFQVADEVVPEGVSFVVAEFAQHKRIPIPSNKSLGVKKLLLECFVTKGGPGGRPTETIQVPTVHQLVRNTVLYCPALHAGQVQLIAQPSHNDQPLRRDL